jgi:hypothetical protein
VCLSSRELSIAVFQLQADVPLVSLFRWIAQYGPLDTWFCASSFVHSLLGVRLVWRGALGNTNTAIAFHVEWSTVALADNEFQLIG